MQKITPFLWFNDDAEAAMRFYTSIFKNSKVGTIMRNGNTVTSVTFQLDGQDFMALNGGPQFKFTEAISLFVTCENQEEVDYFWEKLSEGGEKSRCGWLKDKFGLSWQIVPRMLGELLQDKDPKKANNIMNAMLAMDKIDIETLQRAYVQV